jgi:hypothetical protein
MPVIGIKLRNQKIEKIVLDPKITSKFDTKYSIIFISFDSQSKLT